MEIWRQSVNIGNRYFIVQLSRERTIESEIRMWIAMYLWAVNGVFRAMNYSKQKRKSSKSCNFKQLLQTFVVNVQSMEINTRNTNNTRN
ncbi:uncharacterized protein Smp_201800 [Schistosoma mansoni]|uniref:uncharacterized protein n=1 Tax=Schistosoma mansoni TaxID=6183 RepID=UPI00022DC60D|nr:uncharacterized protein Smp_201800 [Schistosoma mansoni]|eukprot:XP_018650288.1 uncharacterized protein Smp_201800 [Schistosoma mansoni]